MRHGGRVVIDDGNKTDHRIDPMARRKHAADRIAAAHGYPLGAGAAFNAAEELVELYGEVGVALRDAMLALSPDDKAKLVALSVTDRAKALGHDGAPADIEADEE
ncbi:MAG: hypothetical protein WDN08_05300 [Rhizomicrobium sp.]